MKKQELIEKYFLKTLSVEETEIFNELFKNDIAFKKEVTFQQSLQKAIEAEEDITFKKNLQQFENEITPKKNVFAKWAVAASIAILIGLGSLYLLQAPSNQNLFAQNFEPYRNVILPIERGNVSEDLKTKAFAAYEKGTYTKAISLFSELHQQQPQTYYLFYKANSFLATNNTLKAIPLLKDYIATKGDFAEKAEWYLALAYLKENNTEEAIKLLQKIINSKSYNHQKAMLLLKKIK